MQRIEPPTKADLITTLVKKIKDGQVLLETVETGLGFMMPLELLPQEIAEGQKIHLKILTDAHQEERHDDFARRLLEEIIN